MYFPHINEAYLRDEYEVKKKGTYAIAKENGCAPATILKRLKKYGFKIKSPGGGLPLSEFPKLTKCQRDVIIGSMLGDGWINKAKTNCCFAKEQKADFLEYLQWHADVFGEWHVGIVPRMRRLPIKSANGNVINPKIGEKKLTGYHFYSRNHPFFSNLRNKWYPDGYKTIPPDLKLNSLILAVWYADDGSYDKKQGRTFLNTQCFSFEECLRLQQLLEELDVSVNLHPNRKGHVLYIRANSRARFFHLIGKHFKWKCLSYKTP